MNYIVLLLIATGCLIGQDKVWVLVETGDVQFLNPYENDWVPILAKEQIPVKTYITSYPNSKATLFNQTSRFEIPENAYIYVADIFKKSKMEIVAALVQIDAEQLPIDIQNNKTERKFGVTYGARKLPTNKIINKELLQRFNAINFYESIGQFGAATLSLRRLMVKFPDYMADGSTVLRLLNLYVKLELDGYAFEVSNRFIQSMKTDQIPGEIVRLNDTIKKKLTGLDQIN